MIQRVSGWACALLMMLLPSCEATVPPPTSKTESAVFVQAFWMPYMEMDALYALGKVSLVQEAIRTRLCSAVDEGFNTVYVHVRANSDAYYASTVFTPTDGTAALLAQGFDPFAYMVEVGHESGLAVHAWVNPYRIGVDRTRARADEVFEAGGCFYYDPSAAAVRRLVVDGVRELVETYDVDGVQFDDYFYPEGAVETETAAPFESEAFAAATGTLGDWRRANVSALIASVHAVCHARGCAFGVSPSYDIKRNTETMYADVALWASTAEYVDYLCPQLYIGFENEYAPFERVLESWSALPRDPSVALVGGLARYKTGLFEDAYAGVGRAEWAAGGDILARQIEAVRAASWDGVALYGDDTVSGERDTAVVKREAQAMKKELLKNSHISR